MKSSDRVIISKIVQYCDDIETLLNQYDYNYDSYKSEIAFQYSCNMCILQIGELVGRLSEECKAKNRDIPWSAIKAMRNIHAHDYEKVDLDIVWNTLTVEIPELKEKLMDLL